jgi:glutamate-ammonia-ligase adenylyltransferase
MEKKFGLPVTEHGAALDYVVVGLGKLGGREMGYHSDLDLMIVAEGDGRTIGGMESTTAGHWFTELAQRSMKGLSQAGPLGRLYAVDFRLRPTGKSGALVVTAQQLVEYVAGESGQVWERLALMRWRVVRGAPAFAETLTKTILATACARDTGRGVVKDLVAMRAKLESAAGKRSLKRGTGGLMDVEFLVQFCQLKHGRTHPDLLTPNVWDALEQIRLLNILPPQDVDTLREGYQFLRFVESRLRIVTDRPLDEVPQDLDERGKLARRLGFATEDALRQEGDRITHGIRAVFTRWFTHWANGA